MLILWWWLCVQQPSQRRNEETARLLRSLQRQMQSFTLPTQDLSVGTLSLSTEQLSASFEPPPSRTRLVTPARGRRSPSQPPPECMLRAERPRRPSLPARLPHVPLSTRRTAPPAKQQARTLANSTRKKSARGLTSAKLGESAPKSQKRRPAQQRPKEPYCAPRDCCAPRDRRAAKLPPPYVEPSPPPPPSLPCRAVACSEPRVRGSRVGKPAPRRATHVPARRR